MDAWPIVACVGGAGALWWWWAASRRLEVGAWTGIAAIQNPAATIALARARGVDRLCIFVNQEPAPGQPFNTYNRAMVLAACSAFRAAGFKLTLVTWLTPRPDWVGGARVVGQLAQDAGADELEFDLEEEWTALRHWSSSAIEQVTATVIDNARSTFGGKLGADCIVYTDQRVLGPFLKRCDFIVPQAYATKKNAAGLPPGALERKALELFKGYGREVVMGVAGWNQEGANAGLGYREAMRASLGAIRELGVRRVRVWRLELLDANEAAELVAWKSRRESPGGQAAA